MTTHEEIRDVFYTIATAAAKHLTKLGDKGTNQIELVGKDLLAAGDKAVAQVIRDILEKAKMQVIIQSEDGETIDYSNGNPEFLVVADEIDGTENFMYGNSAQPYVIILGACENPSQPTFQDFVVTLMHVYTTGDTYCAIRNKGCFVRKKGEKEWQKIKNKEVRVTVHGYRINYDCCGSRERIKEIAHLMQATTSWAKDFGSTGYHFTSLVSGAADAFINAGGKGEEAGPGYLFAKEVGGAMIDFDGNDFATVQYKQDKRYSFIAARSSKLAQEMQKKL